MTDPRKPSSTGRRQLLAAGGLVAAAALAPRSATASLGDGTSFSARPAELAFYNTHTGERLSLVYREGGNYITEAMSEIDRLLRDHRTGEVARIDPVLLDQLHRLGTLLDAKQPFHVISGYRSPATNAKLAAASGGVAKRSLHMLGQAIDIRLPGRPLQDVRRAALSMQAGGVGYYASSDFVHLDSGRVRAW
ncbi:MAG TPA: DUF882 domain-containing protein [Quisquiliibacterium sp.]|nr:DUF882 domain-containing protein [Quisquiliibacterium sp.]